jgi:hypothetical protein
MARTKGVDRKAHNRKSREYTASITKGLESKRRKKEKKDMSKAKARETTKKRKDLQAGDDEDVADIVNLSNEPKKMRKALGPERDLVENPLLENTPVADFEINCDDGKFLEAGTSVEANFLPWTLRCKIEDGVAKVKYNVTLNKCCAKNR